MADTYNNKIKLVSPRTKSAVTFLGTGGRGLRDGDAPLFDEPGGLSVADGKLYIADTNNHVIRVADLKTKKVSTLELKGIDKLVARVPEDQLAGETVRLQAQRLAPGEGQLILSLKLPDGYKLNTEAPSYVIFSVDGAAVRLDGAKSKIKIPNPRFPLTVPLKVTEGVPRTEGEAKVRVTLVLYYCQAQKEGLCYFKEARIEAPIKASQGAGASDLKIMYDLQPGP